ncbi:ABC transporter substrate-binding protein/permease [Mycolicibacter arupensis]|uniref:Amino acid ABC transporter permease n=1 Tax=Mycolicibacter arupensis TaxID=342002 RepID=A0A0F5MSB4_9MYCO|nr:ABC transporter substrate-binding protein/permease [Mycolicibacter arupensis]KKB97650.1 amino acid ABC transporter permease [Mycolicibacter arupensis]MCV7277742.1 ABC transporter permease subunit [Mycolicibacter arupensis]OQZ96104.1 amino acid ABC transporter permease [Mycolicibacter arupensis]
MARSALRLAAFLATCLIMGSLAAVPPAGAAPDQCAPLGEEAAVALPPKLANAKRPREDKYTTAAVEPLSSVDITKLGLGTPGVLTVGTITESPPTNCINAKGRYTGFDNELLRAIAKKLGLRIQFVGTDFFGLLAQVESGRFDVGSASINATEERRRTVGFTNGYNFGYMALVVPSGSAISGYDALTAGQRIAVVQGTVEDAYVVDTLEIEPVRFPDSITLYASLKSRQVDAWVAPSMTALNLLRPGDPAQIVGSTFSPAGFEAYAVAKGNQALTSALNSGLDAVIADGTWPQLYTDWVPRPLPPDWKPGSKSAATPHLPDFAAIAARHHRAEAEPYTPKSTLAQLRDSFFDWELYRQALPDLIKTGLPNTLLLTVSGGVIGLLAGLGLAVAGISRTRWLRWPARIYTDIFRGLPEVLIILLIGLAVGPLVGGLTHNNPYPLGIAALGLTAAAYIGEILRSGIQSVEAGQLEASRALGFGYPEAMRLVVIPQGIRRVLPALVNQFIALLKASALLYFLGLVAGQRELFQVGRDFNAQTGSLSPLVAAGLLYLALTIPLTHLVNVVDHRLRRGRPPEADDSVELSPAISSQEMT